MPRHSNAPTQVYRFYDKDGVLLYVGVSLSLLSRISAHRHQAAWFPLAAHVEIEHFPTRRAALAQELAYIQNLDPVFNLNGAGHDVPTYRPDTTGTPFRHYVEAGERLVVRRPFDGDWETAGDVAFKWFKMWRKSAMAEIFRKSVQDIA